MRSKKIHLLPKHRRQLEALFKKHLPEVEVWAYGSRVNGKSHPGSDLDLVLRSQNLSEINLLKLGYLKEALTESNIPFLVEARDWAILPKSFHSEIKKNYIVLIKNNKHHKKPALPGDSSLPKKPSSPENPSFPRKRESTSHHQQDAASLDSRLHRNDKLYTETHTTSRSSGQLTPPATKQTEIGPLPQHWGIKCIEDLFHLKQGKSLSAKNQTGLYLKPFLRTANVFWGRLELSKVDKMDIPNKDRSSLTLKKNDLLVCEGGDIGRTAIWNNELLECYYQNHIHRLRIKDDKNTPLFYMYWMDWAIHISNIYGTFGNRTTIPNLSGQRLIQFKIPVPPLEEQERIAGVLSCIQKAIEAQDRLIKVTQELKKSTMKHLFTYGPPPSSHSTQSTVTPREAGIRTSNLQNQDFPTEPLPQKTSTFPGSSSLPGNPSFPRKRESTSHNHQDTASLDSRLHGNDKLYTEVHATSRSSGQLTPPATKQTEIGPLLQHWNIENLGKKSISEIIMGQSPSSKFYNSNKLGLPFYQGKVDFGSYTPSIRQWCSKPLKVAIPNDIFISVRAPVGDVNVCTVKSCIGRGIASIRANRSNLSFLFLFYNLIYRKHDIEKYGVGTTFKSINKYHLHNLKIPVPPLEEQKKIASVLQKIDQKITNHQKKKSTLEDLFKTTLNQLMTGHIQIHKINYRRSIVNNQQKLNTKRIRK